MKKMEIKSRYEIQDDPKLLKDYKKQKEECKKAGKQVAELMLQFINAMGAEGGNYTSYFFEGFFEVILNAHKTLQQVFQKYMILKWIRMQAYKTEGFFDERNQYTVEQCKIMKKALVDAEKHYDPPFI